MRLPYIVTAGLLLASCSSPSPVQSDKLSVAASFYPLAHFAEQIGGKYTTVTQITPSGVEPHEYEPTARDVATILESDILLLNGGGVDTWAEKLVEEFTKKGGTVVRMSDSIEFVKASESGGIESLDPHIWLDPLLAQKEVSLMGRAFAEKDRGHAQFYMSDATVYGNTLKALNVRFTNGLRTCESRDLVVAHDAFGYLGTRYELNIFPIAGLSPEEEPSPKQMADVAKLAREKKVKTIFFETLASPKLAETIADEVNVGTSVLNPIEGLTNEERARGATYVTVMDENLASLRVALDCE